MKDRMPEIITVIIMFIVIFALLALGFAITKSIVESDMPLWLKIVLLRK